MSSQLRAQLPFDRVEDRPGRGAGTPTRRGLGTGHLDQRLGIRHAEVQGVPRVEFDLRGERVATVGQQLRSVELGTSERVDLVRMRATMAEFNTAKLLTDCGYAFAPEIELDSGYALDFRVADPETLIEVTRPEPPARRRAGTPARAILDTVEGKLSTQLAAHPSAVLSVDCSSFRDDEWGAVLAEQPAVKHEPAVVYRMRPDGRVEGYVNGRTALDLSPELG